MRFHALAALALLAACTTNTTETLPAPPRCTVNADCDDGVHCNGVETCDVAANRCVRGAPPACDDGVACTVDLCDEARKACVHVPDATVCAAGEACFAATGCGPAVECAADKDCDDGFFCNGTETCASGRCQHGTPPVCDDGVACTVDLCDEVQGRCVHAGDAWACAADARCSPTQGCVTIPECAADADCDDGVYCNGAETCDPGTGKCKPGVRPSCDDGVACTVDLCDELQKKCVSVSDATRCAAGELCSPTAGCYVPARCAADADCDDGVFCDGAETCNLATGRCQAGTPPSCASGATCTVDVCDEAARACRSIYAPQSAGCAQLTVARTGTGSGTVTSVPAAIACGATCAAWLEPSTVVTLTAASAAGSMFTGWGGACSGNPCAFDMSAPRSVTANFDRILYTVSVARTAGGTVTSTPAGLYCGATCAASFGAGATVMLTAAADPGATFAGWTGACTGTATTCSVTPFGATSVGARFTFPLTVSAAGTGGGTITSAPSGISCGSTCSASFDGGATVTLTAAQDATSTFDGWSGACTGTGACVVTLDGVKSVAATFTRQVASYALTVNRTGEGTVVSTPDGVYCGADCSASYAAGTVVTLVAFGSASSTFTGWSGACTGTGSCVLTMNAARTVTATFVTNTFALTVAKAGAGSGTVTSSPAGISCGTTCAASYASGTVVALDAQPTAGSTFTGWSGACSGTGTCLVALDAAKSVVATFGKASYAVTVAKLGTGGGMVSSSPAGIDCGATCAASFTAGAFITLTATPDSTSTFAGWSGPCTGTSPTCNISVDQAYAPTATFTRKTYALNVTRTAGGTVTTSPAGIYCGAACSATLDAGAAVTLTATPDAGATFAGWSGGSCSGTSTCTLTMDAAKSVNAVFRVPLTVAKTGDGSGSVTSAPAGISCGATCAASYDGGTTVTLTAAPDTTSTFLGWAGACGGTGSCSVSMDAAKTVTALFARQRFDLLVLTDGTGGGSLTSSPAGISCPGACLASYDAATSVTLTAAADPTSTFTGWSGACSGTGTCNVTMNGTKGVVATFARIQYPLTVTRVGAGTVVSSPGGIYCGLACQASYDAGSIVTLTAVPDAGGTFTGWTGACTGVSGTCTVPMAAARAVTASFVP